MGLLDKTLKVLTVFDWITPTVAIGTAAMGGTLKSGTADDYKRAKRAGRVVPCSQQYHNGQFHWAEKP